MKVITVVVSSGIEELWQFDMARSSGPFDLATPDCQNSAKHCDWDDGDCYVNATQIQQLM